jgi:hypothetical protein
VEFWSPADPELQSGASEASEAHYKHLADCKDIVQTLGKRSLAYTSVVTFDQSEPIEARKNSWKMSVDNLLLSDDTHPVVLYDPSLDELLKMVCGTTAERRQQSNKF